MIAANAALQLSREQVEEIARRAYARACKMGVPSCVAWLREHGLPDGGRAVRDLQARVASGMFYLKVPHGVDTPHADEVERALHNALKLDNAAARTHAATIRVKPSPFDVAGRFT